MSPPEPVASLATVSVTRPAKRRHANAWAVGNAATKTRFIPDAESPEFLEGHSDPPDRNKARAGLHPAGCTTSARAKEDGPVTWEAHVSPRIADMNAPP